MIIEGIYLLLTISAITGLIAAIRKDRKFLLSLGIIFIVLGAISITSGIQIPEGETITETELDENTTEITVEQDYTDIEDKTDIDGFSVYLGIIFIGVSIYATFIGALGEGIK